MPESVWDVPQAGAPQHRCLKHDRLVVVVAGVLTHPHDQTACGSNHVKYPAQRACYPVTQLMPIPAR